jgi:hypothetical protein
MAVTWIDGFDLYDATNLEPGASGRYTETVANSVTVRSGRISGQCMSHENNDGNEVSYSGGLGAGSDTVTVGFAFRAVSTALATTPRQIKKFMNGSTVICTLATTDTGRLQFYRGDNSTLLVQSAAGVLSADVWGHIEVALTRHASAGIVEIRFNGSNVASGSSLNTGASIIDGLRFCRVQSLSSAIRCEYDDLFVKNDVSSFLGDCRVETLRPTADTADKDWGRSAGSDNYALVDDTTTDADTTYITSSVTGDKDIYTMGDLINTPSAIYAVQATMVARKDDAAARTVAARVKSNASVSGTTHTMGTSYQMKASAPALVDPDTAGAWAASAVNAAQFELETIS